MEKQLIRAHILISGRVQGIGFRWWVQRQAETLGIVGWVKNLDDGRVEVLAEAEKEKLVELIELVKKGPRFTKVQHVEVKWGKATQEFEGFEIIF